jgi:hypothetical protein
LDVYFFFTWGLPIPDTAQQPLRLYFELFVGPLLVCGTYTVELMSYKDYDFVG